MKFTFDNGNEVEVTLDTDAYGLPAMKVDGFYVASLTPQGKLMLSGLEPQMVPELNLADAKFEGFAYQVIATEGELDYNN